MTWLTLFFAGCLEISWALTLERTHGFTRLWPSAINIALGIASFVLLAHVLKTLPVGTAYAVWTGIGAAGTAALGVAFLGESAEPGRLISICLVVAGVIGLRVFGGE
jgi:quaternary ammonium compound-resistance protein SugE